VYNLGVLTRALRNISRRKIRVVLVVIALGFSLAIMTSLPAGIVSNQIASQNTVRNLENTINQTEAALNQTLTEITCTLSSGSSGYEFPRGGPGGYGGYGFGASSILNESLYTNMTSIPGVDAVAPILQVPEGTTETITRFGRTITRLVPNYVIQGIPLESSLINNYSILPTSIIAGKNLKGGESGVVLLSENNTAYFNAGVNDTVKILGSTFKVVGVYASSSLFGTSALTLYMNLSDAQKITDNVGNITSLEVFANSTSYAPQLATAIMNAYPELVATTAQEELSTIERDAAQYGINSQNAESTLSRTQNTAIEEIAVAVAATSLIVLVVMLYTVRERTKEIGILKAIGFSNWNVMSQFMVEGVLISLMAGVVGIVIGFIGAPYLISFLLPHVPPNVVGFSRSGAFAGTSTLQSVTISPEMMLVTLGAAALLGALGSLYPAWRASRTSPMEALKYE
jgi:putative ABC transport system permease protein